jgi:hypothetical protein
MVRVSKYISNIVLVTGLLVFVSCSGMEKKTTEKLDHFLAFDDLDLKWNITKNKFEWKEGAVESSRIKGADYYIREKELQEVIRQSGENGKDSHENAKDIWEAAGRLYAEEKIHSKFTKIPTPKHITLLSKDAPKDTVAAFKAMINANPTILVVKDLDNFKNPDIKKIREIGNYTLFGDGTRKWVVDNNTGFEVVLSQEIIEKLMQLSTESIQTMIDHDCFNEVNINNCLKHQIN